MKYAHVSRPEAAEWVSEKLRKAGYEVAPDTLIRWRQSAISPGAPRTPKRTDNAIELEKEIHRAYRVVIDAPDWTGEPRAYAEQLITRLIYLHPQKEVLPQEE
jgi:hypothetical protein